MVSFDKNGYIIDGKPVLLASGELQYFKLTRGEWKRRLLQIRLSGLNAVSVYFAWNYHEQSEGEWDFSGDRDVEYFLQLAAECGLYVVARPGPFICNEWTCGGIPAWLSGKKGVRLRSSDPLYLSYCDKWWDKIAPIIAKYQLGREGTIILAQVENEYGHQGAHQEEAYIHHLRDGLRACGVTVPLINCDSFIRFDRIQPRVWEGVNLCVNSGGDGLRVLQRARSLQPDKPLFVTEYWIAAFDWWGSGKSAAYDDKRALYGGLEMLAGGAGGLTVFVVSGGSHFGYWHGQSICSDFNFMTTLYGPGAPILDDGSFSPKYNLFKRHFTGLAACSEALASADMPSLSGDMDGLVTAVRRAGDTVFTFFVNHSKEQMMIADRQKDQGAVDMSIPAGEVRWSVERLDLPCGLRMERTSGHLFAASPALALWSEDARPIDVTLSDPASGETIDLTLTPASDGAPVCETVMLNGKALIVAALSMDGVDRCVRLALPGMAERLIGGIDRVDDVSAEGITAWQSEKRAAWVLDEHGLRLIADDGDDYEGDFTVSLENIRAARDFPEARADFDDSGWFAAEDPQPMAKFGSGNGYAWYRAALNVETTGWQMIYVSGAADRWMFFVDGEYRQTRGAFTHKGRDLAVWLEKGAHQLTILADNLGMFNTGFEMDMPLGEPKGIYGPVWLNGEAIKNWRMRAGLRAGETVELWPAIEDQPFEEAASPVTGPAFVSAEFDLPAGLSAAVRLNAGGGKGSMWLNGFNVGRYMGIGPQTSLWLPLDKLKAHNRVVFFEEESFDAAKTSVTVQRYGHRLIIK